VRNEQGHRLKRVSPRQVITAEGFREWLVEAMKRQRDRAHGEEVEESELDDRVGQLYEAFALFRVLTYDPTVEQSLESNRRLTGKVMTVARLLEEAAPLENKTVPEGLKGVDRELAAARSAVREAFGRFAQTLRPSFTAEKAGPALVAFERATRRLRDTADRARRQVFDDPTSSKQQRAEMNRLAARASGLYAAAGEMHIALYNIGLALRVVPALDPLALRADREPDDEHQPWLSLQVLLHGSDPLLADYPQEPLQAARAAFSRLADAYRDRDDPDRPSRVKRAAEHFAAAMRELGEAIEPLRRDLSVPGDEADRMRILAATAYPPPGFHKAELHYNRANPFLWSWIIYLAATASLAMSFGIIRRPAFWLGIVLIATGIGMLAYGLSLRTYITGWTAVTNMFETVVLVAAVVALMGLWFTLIPLLWPGLRRAWQWTALPLSQRSHRMDGTGGTVSVGLTPDHQSTQAHGHRPVGPAGLQWALFALRLALAAALFYALTMLPYGSAGRAVIRLLPETDVGASLPTLNDLLAWSVGLGVLAIIVWLVPRTVLAALLAPVTIVADWIRHGVSKPLAEVYRRRLFAGTGAAVGFLTALVAYQAPIFNRDIEALQPILRDNFWLTVHVVSITASYGAGALAWGLANISMAYYLFGRYRDPVGVDPSDANREDTPSQVSRTGRRPPEACTRLALFTYRAIQVAVLLLAVGTILGALWADVAWGRFWSFDAKETWSLISILVYMIILHARYIGWSGDFGLAVGAVLGASAILMAWYGVNYVLGSGLHTYGGGVGGQREVFLIVAVNWLFVAAAATRYSFERMKA